MLVDAGYQDNSPIPRDPGVTRPMGLLPPASQNAATAQQLPGAVAQGAQAAQQDLSSPSGVMTNPLSTLASGVPAASLPKPTTPSITKIAMTGGNTASPGSSTSGASSPAGTHPVHQVVGSVSSALNGLAGTLKKGSPTKPSGASGSAGTQSPAQ